MDGATNIKEYGGKTSIFNHIRQRHINLINLKCAEMMREISHYPKSHKMVIEVIRRKLIKELEVN